MKLADIVKLKEILVNEDKRVRESKVRDARSKRNLLVGTLLKTDIQQCISNSNTLSPDEIELALQVITKLKRNALYEPSESLSMALQMIVSNVDLESSISTG